MFESTTPKSNGNRPMYKLSAKVLVVGDSGVGKSSLILRYVENEFIEHHLESIAIEVKQKSIELEGKTLEMELWDTMGIERYRPIVESYFKETQSIILVYACDNRESFDNLEGWLKQIDQLAEKRACKMLIGNKYDSKDRTVSYDEGKKLAEAHRMDFFEVSAKENLHVDEAFRCLAGKIAEEFPIERYCPEEEESRRSRRHSSRLLRKKSQKEREKGFDCWLRRMCFLG